MTSSSPNTLPTVRATGVDTNELVNWNWTVADMDRLKVMLDRSVGVDLIASAFGTTQGEIFVVCFRNGLRRPKPSFRERAK